MSCCPLLRELNEKAAIRRALQKFLWLLYNTVTGSGLLCKLRFFFHFKVILSVLFMIQELKAETESKADKIQKLTAKIE